MSEVLIRIAVPDGEGGETVYEPGDTVTWKDLQHADIRWLVDKGALDESPAKPKKKKKGS